MSEVKRIGGWHRLWMVLSAGTAYRGQVTSADLFCQEKHVLLRNVLLSQTYKKIGPEKVLRLLRIRARSAGVSRSGRDATKT